MNILIIDDDSFALKLFARQLQHLGYPKIILQEYARSALAYLKRDINGINLLICDLQMPEMDGIEFLRQVAQLDYRGHVILVSGEDRRILQTAEKLARAHKLNVLGCLQKPVSPEQLQKMIDSIAATTITATRPAPITYSKAELWRAISAGELLNYYQPKVRLATGEVIGVEALVRWRHPSDGLIFPDQFIPVAEEYNLMDDLTKEVLTAALSDVSFWQETILHLHVAVNISIKNLADVKFPDIVANLASKAGVSAANLVLEVTESQLMTDRLAPLDILTRLRLKRIGLSIDDFGTGHSSLSQLRDVPFNELKMDRSFVHGAHSNPLLRAIVEANQDMARKLNMTTVGEGVEDRADWDYLHETGCDFAQGYFIAKPMPAANLPDWITGWETRRNELV